MADLPEEFDLIETYLAPLADPDVAFGLKDDAAQLNDLILTKDMIVEGVHFFPDDAAHLIAQKALRVNLSDLAAKGAKPLGYLMGLTAPKTLTRQWIESFQEGLKADQKKYGISLFGGDTVFSDSALHISVTAIGKAPKAGMIKRSGARKGDLIVVTGDIGDSWLGLQVKLGLLDLGVYTPHVINHYHLPNPQVTAGQVLAHVATAAADISDGLLADLNNIAVASQLQAVVEATRIPISYAARTWLTDDKTADPVKLWTGGDDFQLIATVPASTDIATLAEKMETPVSVIGHMDKGLGLALLDSSMNNITPDDLGYRHRVTP